MMRRRARRSPIETFHIRAFALLLPFVAVAPSHAQEPADVVTVSAGSETPFEFDVGDGDGPAVNRFAVSARHRGALSIWVESDLRIVKPTIEVRRADGALLAQHDGDGGVRAPWVLAEVEEGEVLRVLARSDRSGDASLVVRETVETEATEAVAAEIRAELAAIEKLGRAEVAAAEAGLRELADRARSTEGSTSSRALEDVLFHIGRVAWFRSLVRVAHDAWHLSLTRRESSLPGDHPDLQKVRLNYAATLARLEQREEARALQEKVLATFEQTLPDDHFNLQAIRLNYALTLRALGRFGEALALQERVLEVWETSLPDDHDALQTIRQSYASTLSDLGRLEEAKALQEKVLAIEERTVPEDDYGLQTVRDNYALTLLRLGHLEQARAVQEKLLGVLERTVPRDHPGLQTARLNHAAVLKELGRLEEARVLEEKVVTISEQVLPDDHTTLQIARQNYAGTLLMLGRREEARLLLEKVLGVYGRSLSAEDSRVLKAKTSYAAALNDCSRLDEARAIEEEVLAIRERTLPDDHPDLLAIRHNYATTLRQCGRLDEARAIQEEVLAIRERTLPDDHPDLLSIRQSLASTLKEYGKLDEAWALEQRVLATREKTLPDDHPGLLASRRSHAATLVGYGRLEQGRALLERVLAIEERRLPDDHPDLLYTRWRYGMILHQIGRLEEARVLFENVLAIRERSLPRTHHILQASRMGYASLLTDLGRPEDARALQEQVLAVWEETLPEVHPDLLKSRTNYAATLRKLGRVEEAAAVVQRVLAAWARTRPDTDSDLQKVRIHYAFEMATLGRAEEARGEVSALLHGAMRRVQRSAAAFSGAGTAGDLHDLHLDWVLSLSAAHSSDACFLLVEAVRDLAARRAALLALLRRRSEQADPEIEARLDRLRELAESLTALSQGSWDGATDVEPALLRDRLHDLLAERQTVEQGLARRLENVPGAAQLLAPPSVEEVAASLEPGDALVSIWPYRRYELETPGTDSWTEGDAYVAFVLQKGEPVRRIELGPREPIDEAVSGWRAAVGKAVEEGPARSPTPADEAEGDPPGEGVAFRDKRIARHGRIVLARVLDPVLDASPATKRLIIAAGGALHLLPLDALPARRGDGHLGDEFEIAPISGVFQMLRARNRRTGAPPALLAVGDIDYEADTVAGAPSRPPGRGAARRGFVPLPETGREVERLVEEFGAAFGVDSTRAVLRGAAASRAALQQAAPEVRHLHIATHGFFAPESVPSLADEGEAISEDPSLAFLKRQSLANRFRGFAPDTLCGLALAGANAGPRPGTPAPGLITAAQLAHLDLSRCELAVLSACETNVGVQRASQGIASLQEALHAAGARSAITSLWRVSDRASMELMTEFYRRLWRENEPPHRALWHAKEALRDGGYPIRDWAAWVLSGPPD